MNAVGGNPYACFSRSHCGRKKALLERNVPADEIGAVVYAGVCREHFEPATACQVAAAIGVQGNAAVYDTSNACLGVLNGVLDIANRIELGQIRAGLVVACESSREINEIMIQRMLDNPSMELFTKSLATLTGGSGAAAVLLTDGSFAPTRKPKLLGGVNIAEPQYHELCRWGINNDDPENPVPYMATDAVAVMKHGVELGKRTWNQFSTELGITAERISKVICHQVGEAHQKLILQTSVSIRIKIFRPLSSWGTWARSLFQLQRLLPRNAMNSDRGIWSVFLGSAVASTV